MLPTCFSRAIVFFTLSFTASAATAQYVVEATNSVPVLREGGSTFFTPWTGGANAVQLSKIDADFDGQDDDIFLFDRAGNRTTVLIGENASGTMTYSYNADFRSSFPNMRNFALLRDYDCDGKKDIFTYSSSGGALAIYRNVGTAQNLTWELVSDALLSYYDFGAAAYTTNIYTSSQDIPAIFDYEGDGDLDVMSFNVGGTFIELHLNRSMDESGNCGLDFFLANRCYGGFIEGDDSNDIVLDPDVVVEECDFNVVDPRSTGGLRHIGSTILTLDGNGDGLQDLVLGDVGFNNLVYLENSQEAEVPDQILSFDPNFPSTMGDSAVNIDNFPSAFHEDVDGDGVSDLIVSVNAANGAATYESIHLYLNSGSENAPDFQFATQAFLQNEMMDWGSLASPTAVDYNGDGLTDLVVGCGGDFSGGALNIPRLILLENVGSSDAPAFQVITSNWLNIASLVSSSNPSPAFGDADNDGDPDLVVGFSNGSLHYFENDNGWTYAGLIPSTDGIAEVGNSATPAFVDIDTDGKIDLVVGEEAGNLNYFKNNGDASGPLFTLENETLGEINTTVTPPFFEGRSAPCFYNFGNVRYVAVGSKSGKIFQYQVGNAGDEWPEVEVAFNIYSTFDAAPIGLSTKPAVVNLNNDEFPEVITGLVSGGLEYFNGQGFLSAESERERAYFGIKLFPNPAENVLRLEYDSDKEKEFKRLTLSALDGRILLESNTLRNTYNLSGLAAGTYVVTVEFTQGVQSEVLIKK